MAAQEGPGIVIVRPDGQDVELPCSVALPGTVQPGVAWIINYNRYNVASLSSGTLDGYSADINSSNLIVKNIVMNDDRNNTEHRCSIIMSDMKTEDSDPTFLYVAGEYVPVCTIVSSCIVCGMYKLMFSYLKPGSTQMHTLTVNLLLQLRSITYNNQVESPCIHTVCYIAMCLCTL